jgi:hypothetical protein
MNVFCAINRIDESLKLTHLRNNHSVLNMWLGTSQKLGYELMIMGVEAPIHQTAQVRRCSSGHDKLVVHLWALEFLDTHH